MQQLHQSPGMSSQQQQSEEKQFLQGRWTEEEHVQFLKAVLIHGKDWKKVEDVISTRNGSQVRSHAQKFFLKIVKINKQRRRHKNKPFLLSETENQILSLFTEEDITQNSPSEIVSIIQKQFNQTPSKMTASKSQKQHKRASGSESQGSNKKARSRRESLEELDSMPKQVDQVGLPNFQKQEDVFPQEQSLFMQHFKKNADHFKNGGQFSDLIDFGKNVAECEQTSPRKQSFSIMDFDQGNFPGLK